jgi:hypothetical protein
MPHFIVIEKDTTMQSHLEKIITGDQIIFADVLETDPAAIIADT